MAESFLLKKFGSPIEICGINNRQKRGESTISSNNYLHGLFFPNPLMDIPQHPRPKLSISMCVLWVICAQEGTWVRPLVVQVVEK